MASSLVNYRRRSLNRSCQACIRAKHRCTRQLPKCYRCSTEAIHCQYDNTPLCPGGSDRHFDMSDLAGLALAEHRRSQETTSEIARLLGARLFFAQAHPSVSLSETCICLNTTAHGIDLTLDHATLAFLAGHLRSYPAVFAETHATPFIHVQLYQRRMPKPIRDAWVICSAQTSNTKDVASYWSVVDGKLALLKQSTIRAASLHLKLASCHALMLYLILSLFHRRQDHNLSVARLVTHFKLLRDWTMILWEGAPASLDTEQSSAWATWSMAESVRRTILTSYLLQGVFNVLNSGITRHTLFVSSLPFDVRTWLWEIDDELQWAENTISVAEDQSNLASYREYTDAWQSKDLLIHGVFEALLIAACKGRTAMIYREQRDLSY